jgi:hypothetical protein
LWEICSGKYGGGNMLWDIVGYVVGNMLWDIVGYVVGNMLWEICCGKYVVGYCGKYVVGYCGKYVVGNMWWEICCGILWDIVGYSIHPWKFGILWENSD